MRNNNNHLYLIRRTLSLFHKKHINAAVHTTASIDNEHLCANIVGGVANKRNGRRAEWYALQLLYIVAHISFYGDFTEMAARKDNENSCFPSEYLNAGIFEYLSHSICIQPLFLRNATNTIIRTNILWCSSNKCRLIELHAMSLQENLITWTKKKKGERKREKKREPRQFHSFRSSHITASKLN